MRRTTSLLTLIVLAASGLFAYRAFAREPRLPIQGRFVATDAAKQDAWYVHPSNGRRYRLTTPEETFKTLKPLAARASQDLLEKPAANDAGRLLTLKTSPERLWYIVPETLSKSYFEATEKSFVFLKDRLLIVVDPATLVPFKIANPPVVQTVEE